MYGGGGGGQDMDRVQRVSREGLSRSSQLAANVVPLISSTHLPDRERCQPSLAAKCARSARTRCPRSDPTDPACRTRIRV